MQVTLRDCIFPNLEVALLFYSWYAKMNGFATRKSKERKNNKKEIVQQTFVCFRQGFREQRRLENSKNQKCKPKPKTRCGCQAECCVHVDVQIGRWIVTYFSNEHNHEMLDDLYPIMLQAHRKMNKADVNQMHNMRKVGITTPQIYGSFAHMVGVFQ